MAARRRHLFRGWKAWSEGKGHIIPSLPGAPAQTKYPPLYPMLLSLVWSISPRFPDNLTLATLFTWLFLQVFLFLCLRVFRLLALSVRAGWLLTGLLALNTYIAIFSRTMFSDMLFTVLVLGVVLSAFDGL
jgi:hypothetical protein